MRKVGQFYALFNLQVKIIEITYRLTFIKKNNVIRHNVQNFSHVKK